MRLFLLIVAAIITTRPCLASSVCVLLPTPAHEAEVIGIVQYPFGVHVIVGVTDPPADIIAIQVLDPRVVDLPIDVPPLSITEVQEVRGRIPLPLIQDIGLRVLYDWQTPGLSETFSYDLLGDASNPFFPDGQQTTPGWLDSPILGWVYLDPSGWAFSEGLGWISPEAAEAAEDPTDRSQCWPTGLWFWSDRRARWGYTTSALYPAWTFWQGEGWTESRPLP